MSGLWTPGQRPPNQIDVHIADGPQGSVLTITGIPFVVPVDGGISSPVLPLEVIEGIAELIKQSAAKTRSNRAAALELQNGSIHQTDGQRQIVG